MKRSTFTPKKPKAKKCPICLLGYVPVRPMQPCCDAMQCKIEYSLANIEKVKAKEAKVRRNATKVALEKFKRLPELKADAQEAFNRYIRARDLGAGRPCICCGKPFEPQKPGGSADAGHYLGVSAAPHLRYNELNCHAQRKNCNRPGGTTRVAFRLGMIARIGLEAVEALESDNTPRHYSKDDLRALAAEYRAKLKVLAKANQ